MARRNEVVKLSDRQTEKGRSISWAVPVCAIAIVIGLFLFYASDSTRTVIPGWGDCVEYQIIGAVGGIPHQPYPLWCVLTNVASLVPVGEQAFRVTLLGVLFGALAVGGLFVLIFVITGDLFISIVSAVAFGLSSTHWRHSVVPEVSSLNTALLVFFFLVLHRWLKAPRPTNNYLLMLSLGFLCSHHQVNIAILPGVAFLWWSRRESLRVNLALRHIIGGVGAFAFPFTLYLYTYFMDRNAGGFNWLDSMGQYLYQAAGNDPAKYDSFFERLRFQMWPARYDAPVFRSPQELVAATWVWIRNLFSSEFPFLGPFLIFVGFVASWRRDVEAAIYWLITAGAYAFIALNWTYRTDAYSIPVFVVFSVYLAFGLQVVTRRLRRNARFAVLGVFAMLLLSLPILRQATASPLARVFRSEEGLAGIDKARHRFHHLDARSNRDGETYALNVIKQIPPGSLIFGLWPEANQLLYYKLVLGELQQIDIEFAVPSREYILGRIADIQPSRVYFTCDPQSYGLETVGIIDIEPNAKLYRVRL